MSYVYLASPYSHAERKVRTERFVKITEIAATLFKQGHIMFCPITQSHNIALFGDIQGSWEFWEKVDIVFLEKADELWVVKLEGWDESVGVAAEIEYANQSNIPVKYIDPKTLKFTEETEACPSQKNSK